MFKTELHLHSTEVSRCCDCPTEISARRYAEAGYTTVTVTDHLNPAFRREGEAWEACVLRLMSGYETFRRLLAGRVHVLFGFELRLAENDNDYLVFGLGRDFLLENPDLMLLNLPSAAKRIHEAGGLIYQAHPFRNRMTVTDPKDLDGVEIFNAHNGHDSRNELAYAFARHHGLAGIAGSDYHHLCNAPSAGILTEAPITCEEELLSILREGKYRTFGEIAPRG